MVYVYYRKLIIEMKFPYEENDCNYFSNSKISIFIYIIQLFQFFPKLICAEFFSSSSFCYLIK